MQALGDDDFVCIACSDSSIKDKSALHSLEQDNVNDSKYAGSNVASAETPTVKSKTNNQNTHDSCMNSYSPDRNPQQSPVQVQKSMENNDTSAKNKSKRADKSNKSKKDEIQDKSYILELESQIVMLKSTIDLYQKTNDQKMNQNLPKVSGDHTEPNSCKEEHNCKHKCCSDLADKIQENRLRMIETQMVQNMYISSALHTQLATQIRTSYPPQIPPYVDQSNWNG